MSDDFSDTSQFFVLLPPDPEPEPPASWWARHATALREWGLGALSFGCVIAALGLGGDMTLTIIVLCVGLVMGTIALATVPKKSIAWKMVTIALLLLFFAAEGVFLYWHFHKESSPSASIALLLDCRMAPMPTYATPNSEFGLLQITDPDVGAGIGIGIQQIGSDGKINWPKEAKVSSVWRCELTNFEDYPIFNVSMSFKLDFLSVIKTKENPGGSRSGNIISSRNWPIGYNYINPKATVVFYAFGRSKFYAQMLLPQYAGYLRGNSDTRLITKLRPPSFSAMSFFPVDQN